MRLSGSRRSPRRTRCCRIPRSVTFTTVAATRWAADSAASTVALARWLRLQQPGGCDVRPADLTRPTVAGAARSGCVGPPRSGACRRPSATKPLAVDTAVLCPRCNGSGASEGSRPVRCSTCHGQGDVTHVQRSPSSAISGPPSPVPPAAATARSFRSLAWNAQEMAGPRHPNHQRQDSAGVSTGNRIHLSKGEVGAGGGPAGDLYVELQVAA